MTKVEMEKFVSTLSERVEKVEKEVEMEKFVSTLSERVEKVEKEIEVLKAPKASNPPKPPTRSLVFR